MKINFKKAFHSMTMLCMLGVLWMMPAMTVAAGDINSYEQAVLDASKGPFIYNGKEYVPTASATRRLENYLKQDDVDFTEEQAQEAIEKGLASVAEGVANGYLVPVVDESKKGSKPSSGQSGQGGQAQPGSEQTEGTQLDETQSEVTPSEGTQSEGKLPEGAQSSTGAQSSVSGQTNVESASVNMSETLSEPSMQSASGSIKESEGMGTVEGNLLEDSPDNPAGTKISLGDKKFNGGIDILSISVIIVVVVLVISVIVIIRHKNRFKKRLT